MGQASRLPPEEWRRVCVNRAIPVLAANLANRGNVGMGRILRHNMKKNPAVRARMA